MVIFNDNYQLPIKNRQKKKKKTETFKNIFNWVRVNKRKLSPRTSLVVQWLRIHLAVQVYSIVCILYYTI